MSLIATLKEETLSKISLVSFRNLGAVGHTVAVRRIRSDNPDIEDRFEWSYGSDRITEDEAAQHLVDYNPNSAFSPTRINFCKKLKKSKP